MQNVHYLATPVEFEEEIHWDVTAFHLEISMQILVNQNFSKFNSLSCRNIHSKLRIYISHITITVKEGKILSICIHLFETIFFSEILTIFDAANFI